MKKKYKWIVSLSLIFFLSLCINIKANAGVNDLTLISNRTIVGSTGTSTISITTLNSSTTVNDFEGKGTVLADIDCSKGVGTQLNLYINLTTSFGGSLSSIYDTGDLQTLSRVKLVTIQCSDSKTYLFLYCIKKDGSMGRQANLLGITPSQSMTFITVSVPITSGATGYVVTPVTTVSNLSDITTYPVGTVKIVQPMQNSKFDNSVSNLIDFEIYGKIPISIEDSKFIGLGEEKYIKEFIVNPIISSGGIYIDGKIDTLGIVNNSASSVLGDGYGVTVLGDLADWKKAGYYCFKYKFSYSPKLSNSIKKITFGVSAMTSFKSGYFLGTDDCVYKYYSDDLNIGVDNYIDYNGDGKDDVTGEDLSNLNDNSSNVVLSKNATISETMEYYSNKFYDGITGIIKTPFTMLESGLALGDTYLLKITAILAPVGVNFKQLLSFVPEDIMNCIWAIIACRLTWTTVRSFIAMLTKR